MARRVPHGLRQVTEQVVADVRELMEQGVRALPGDRARREAALLLRYVLNTSEAWLVAHADEAVEDDRATGYRALIERRARGEPVAYLTGTRGFHALELRVTPDVLIPRPETELLVELALARIPPRGPDGSAQWGNQGQPTRDEAAAPHPAYRIADLGTGSGAVALAIARARPDVRVLATDASAAALAVARDNAQRLHLMNVDYRQGDWCQALGDTPFALIVSNPPYIAEDDPHLREGDLRFEPRSALASGPDGLDAIRSIVPGARAHLRPGGWLMFEHGFEQGPAVRKLLAAHDYTGIFTKRDLEGRDRVSGGRAASGDEASTYASRSRP